MTLQDTKNEKRRAQMATARRTLERSTMLLLTSTKVCLRHPECHTARINRDTVFTQMRRAMDLIHFVIKEGVNNSQRNTLPIATLPMCHSSSGYAGSSYSAPSGCVGASQMGVAVPGTASPIGGPHLSHLHATSTSSSSSSSIHIPFDPTTEALLQTADLFCSDDSEMFEGVEGQSSQNIHLIPKYERRGKLHRYQQALPNGSFVLAVESTLKWLHEQLDTCPTIVNLLRRVLEMMELARMGPLTGSVKEQMIYSLEAAIERTQDFTDSADTNHAIRERILLLSDQIRAELPALFRAAATIFALVSTKNILFFLHYFTSLFSISFFPFTFFPQIIFPFLYLFLFFYFSFYSARFFFHSTFFLVLVFVSFFEILAFFPPFSPLGFLCLIFVFFPSSLLFLSLNSLFFIQI